MQIWLTLLVNCQTFAGLGIGVDNRLGAVIGALVAAAHDTQLAVLGPCLPAGDRRVNKADLLGICHGVQLAGDFGGYGGVIHEDRACRQACERPVIAQTDRAQVVVIADAGHYEISALRGLARS